MEGESRYWFFDALRKLSRRDFLRPQLRVKSRSANMFFSVLVVVAKVLLLTSGSAADEKTSCRKVVSFEETEKPISSKFLKTRGVINVVQPLPINLTVKYEIPVYFTKKYEGDLRLADSNDVAKNTEPGKPYSAKYYLYFEKGLPVPTVTLVQVNDKVLCSNGPISSVNKTIISRYHYVGWAGEHPVIIDPHSETNAPKNAKNETEEGGPDDKFVFFQSHTYSVELYHHNPFLHPTEKKKEGEGSFDFVYFSTSPSGHYHSNPFLYPSERPTPVSQPRPTAKPTPRPTAKPTPKPTPRPTQTPIQPPATPGQPPFTVSPPGSCRNSNWKLCCGVSMASNHLIVNGVESRKRDFRWMVPLFKMTNIQYQDFEFICTSTLISDNYILTAAHCVVENSRVVDENRFLAPVGMFQLDDWSDPDVQSRKISQIYVHPDYDERDGDIALLKLNSKVVIGPAVVPACIWSEKDDLDLIVGRKSLAFGWGRDARGQITEIPNLAMMPIVSQEQCLRSNVNFQTATSNRTFCAGKKDGSGPCRGDSGGGLLLLKKHGDGTLRWYLRGVVSASLRSSDFLSCDLYNYIIFSDVAKYRRWIRFYVNI